MISPTKAKPKLFSAWLWIHFFLLNPETDIVDVYATYILLTID